MSNPFKEMKETESFKMWERAITQVVADLAMAPLRYKYNFGRISIHSGEICVAFYSDGKAFFRTGGTEIGNAWLEGGSVQLTNAESGKRVKRAIEESPSLESLKRGYTSIIQRKECKYWISAPDSISGNPMKLTELILLCKPTAKYLKSEKVIQETDYIRNPNIYGALYDLLTLAGYQSTAQIQMHSIGQIVHNMREACIGTGHKYTKKVMDHDAKLIRRLVAIHRGIIYSVVTEDMIKDAVFTSISYQRRKTA
ncbi:hypothetical protein [Vibrio fluvialis]|uniref:hypothetical protein n=1 Tax=Vibrio fluvialis TaxID=676 RepID=UPI0023A9CA31|nr:hypothetical protein [Vibrio fluvialis]MDE5179064.1 hypothetical protein [Vibrio fluvialis]